MRAVSAAFFLVACSSSKTADPTPTSDSFVTEAKVLVSGHDVTNQDCRTGICRHNENTDLFVWNGATYLVHRTAQSQVLGPNSSLWIYRTTDAGKSWETLKTIPAPTTPLGPDDKADKGRDLRDPHFYVVGDTLFIKALTRLPVTSSRDSGVDTIAVYTTSKDGKTWTDLKQLGPVGQSFWRIKKAPDGTLYTAAYQDGDAAVTLFSSKNGVDWTKGAVVYDVFADSPLETELEFMPKGKMLAIVRTDGDEKKAEYLDPAAPGANQSTRICWASPPFDKFDCPQALQKARLDGPVTFWWKNRLFVVARKHLVDIKKRTALFELTGDFDGGALTLKEWGELPSAGDTAYAGVAPVDDTKWLTTWYSSDVEDDANWLVGM
ncbi:MAG: sialidase family protein, partial [Polyangiales bacterium]